MITLMVSAILKCDWKDHYKDSISFHAYTFCAMLWRHEQKRKVNIDEFGGKKNIEQYK